MKSIHEGDASAVNQARTRFLESHHIAPDDTTLVRLTYGRDDYCTYRTVSSHDKGDGITRPSTIIADALVTTEPNHALFLPLADCIGAVIHDPTQNILMLSHLGRHNLEQLGGTKSIEYLVEQFACLPENLTVWLSPAAGAKNYPLFAFNNHSLHDVAYEQLQAAGIRTETINISPVDTTIDTNYFSHSEFIKGNRPTDGRFAVATQLTQ